MTDDELLAHLLKDRAEIAEAALVAAQKRVRNLEATIGWVANMTRPGNRAVINATELLNSIHDHARAALAEEIDNDKR